MTSLLKHLRCLLYTRLERSGKNPDAFLASATEIVIFGSQSAGLQTRRSDLDVLCVGTGSRLKSDLLDLCWVSEEALIEQPWQGSELANHIGEYGLWLRGTGEWCSYVATSEASIERKRRRILAVARTATLLSQRLHPVFRSKYDITIRRELQRLRLLEQRRVIPPTKVLDIEWRSSQRVRHELLSFRASIPSLADYSTRSDAPLILRLAPRDLARRWHG
jgi:hypothetical protein